MLNIGVLMEGKVPQDKRVPLIPGHITRLKQDYSEISVHVQRSDIRCYPDSEYNSEGINLVDEISDCDILFGVKEVPIPELIANKTYLFFSHTTKEQPYNKSLLKEILNKKITLIDYEGLTDNNGKRIVAFGRYAGIVGAYNGLFTYGLKFDLFKIRRANDGSRTSGHKNHQDYTGYAATRTSSFANVSVWAPFAFPTAGPKPWGTGTKRRSSGAVSVVFSYPTG